MKCVGVITRIKVGPSTVGIIGLQAALAKAAAAGLPSNEDTARCLLRALRSDNYFVPALEAEYAVALLCEYKRFKGELCEPAKPLELEIKVLGPGCPGCERLERLVREVMAAEGLAGSLEHVREIEEITTYGILATPGLVINGKVKCAGRVPPEKQLREWLREAQMLDSTGGDADSVESQLADE